MSETKVYTWQDLQAPEAQDKKGLLMLIHGKVYNISKFLDEVSLSLEGGGSQRQSQRARSIRVVTHYSYI